MQHLLPDDAMEGQGLVEYALIIVLVALAVIALLSLLGGGVGTYYNSKIIGSLTSSGF